MAEEEFPTGEQQAPAEQPTEFSSQSRGVTVPDPVQLPVPGAPAGMADIQRRKMDATTGLQSETEKRLEQDRAYMQERFNAMGVETEKLKPWDQEKQREKFQTNPLEAFGSFGVTFGLIASAFTNAPMENALNASASAMNAIRAGDDKEYDRAYTAWKDNMNLVVKRHDMMQAQFKDAQALFTTDTALGEAKAKNIATKFGDQQSLLLLDSGMNKEWFDLLEARNKAVVGASKASEQLNETGMRKAVFDQMMAQAPEAARKDPSVVLRMWERAYGIKANTPEEEATFKYLSTPKANGELPSPEEAADFAVKLKQRTTGSGANANLTTDRQRAQDVLAYRENLKKSVDPETGEPYSPEKVGELAARYEQKLKATATPITANTRDQLRSMVDRTQYFEKTVDNVEGLLAKHNGLTGIGGKVLRPTEAVGNIFGSNDTDRKQFERWISEMKEWAPRILNESRGRPLASEAAQVNSIVAGLSLGDTTANTVRAYRELRPLIAKIREDLMKRESGTWSAPASGSFTDTGGSGSAKPKWQNAPIIAPAQGKRSSNLSDSDITGMDVTEVPPQGNLSDYIPNRV